MSIASRYVQRALPSPDRSLALLNLSLPYVRILYLVARAPVIARLFRKVSVKMEGPQCIPAFA